MQNNKTLSTSFNEKELFETLRNVCHDLDYAPDVLTIRPEYYLQLEAYSAHYDNNYLEHSRKNP